MTVIFNDASGALLIKTISANLDELPGGDKNENT